VCGTAAGVSSINRSTTAKSPCPGPKTVASPKTYHHFLINGQVAVQGLVPGSSHELQVDRVISIAAQVRYVLIRIRRFRACGRSNDWRPRDTATTSRGRAWGTSYRNPIFHR
jgi:hypothetical protein